MSTETLDLDQPINEFAGNHEPRNAAAVRHYTLDGVWCEALTIRGPVDHETAEQRERDAGDAARSGIMAELRAVADAIDHSDVSRIRTDLAAAQVQLDTVARDKAAGEAALRQACFAGHVGNMAGAEARIADASQRHATATRRRDMLSDALATAEQAHRNYVKDAPSRKAAELLEAAREERREIVGKLIDVMGFAREDVMRVNAALELLTKQRGDLIEGVLTL
jgi:hypothetical protein